MELVRVAGVMILSLVLVVGMWWVAYRYWWTGAGVSSGSRGRGASAVPKGLLIPVEDAGDPDVYLAVGPEDALAKLGGEPLFLLGRRAGSKGTTEQLDAVLRTASAEARVDDVEGYRPSARVVRLQPETVRLLESGTTAVPVAASASVRPADADAAVARLRWVPAGPALVSAASTEGPLTTATIQWQLAGVSGSIVRVEAQVARMSKAGTFSRDDRLEALVAAAVERLERLRATGLATPEPGSDRADLARRLDREVRRLGRRAASSVSRLTRTGGAGPRGTRLERCGIAAVSDLAYLILCVQAWTQVEGISISGFAAVSSGKVHTADPRGAEEAWAAVRDRADGVLLKVSVLAQDLRRGLVVVAETPDSVRPRRRAGAAASSSDDQRDRITRLAAEVREVVDAAGLPGIGEDRRRTVLRRSGDG